MFGREHLEGCGPNEEWKRGEESDTGNLAWIAIHINPGDKPPFI
jgi:hypothetical protein